MPRCINCWIAIPITQQYRYNATHMNLEIISVLEEWIARQVINEDYLCQECVSLLILESNNRNEGNIGERQFGHDAVCVCCGISISRRTGRRSRQLNYGDAKWIYFANIISPLEPSNAQACNACWLRAYRQPPPPVESAKNEDIPQESNQFISGSSSVVEPPSSASTDIENILREPVVNSSDHVCKACWDLAQRSSVDEPRQLGHRNVCSPCGRSLASRASHVLNTDSTRELRIYNVVQEWIRPRTVEVASRICHTCWMAADRTAIRSATSGPSSASQGCFDKSDISVNTNQHRSAETALHKVHRSNELANVDKNSGDEDVPGISSRNASEVSSRNEVKVFCPKCNTEVSHTAEGMQEDQTKILIAKVYHFFEQEYEEMKKVYGDLDLTSLSKFHQRTALATGVSETTLLQILKEEEERNADKQREPPQNLSAARKRRRETDSEEPENSENLEIKLEPSDGEIDNEEPEIFIPPAIVEHSDGETDTVQTDPISLDVKTEPRDDEVDTTSESLALNEPADSTHKEKKISRSSDCGDTSIQKKVIKIMHKPRRPMSAYMIWLNSAREQIKSENPGMKVTELARKGGEIWRALDKSVWEEKAAKLKEQYEKDMEIYLAQDGGGRGKRGKRELQTKSPKKMSAFGYGSD